jgi:hypothetical protein
MSIANVSDEVTKDGEPWRRDHAAVHIERLVDIDGVVRDSMLRHPTYPFERRISADVGGLDAALRGVACEYLFSALEEKHRPIVVRLCGGEDELIGWLGHLEELEDGSPAPPPAYRYSSFWVERVVADRRVDRTAVLLVGPRLLLDDGGEAALGGRCGLRVVAHVGPDVGGFRKVRVTGMSMRGLQHLLRGSPEPLLTVRGRSLSALAVAVLPQARRAFSLSGQNLTGIRLNLQNGGVTLFGRGILDEEGTRRVVAWQAEYYRPDGARQFLFAPGPVDEQVAAAVGARAIAGETRFMVFGRDAASQKPALKGGFPAPSAADEVLDQYRNRTAVIPGTELTGIGPAGSVRFEVMKSQVVDLGKSNEIMNVPTAAAGKILRSDDLAAVHAFERARELFERFDSYGFQPGNVFKQARLPLRMRHRAVLPGGTSGNTVNAMVRTDAIGTGLDVPFDEGLRPRLEVLFGSAALANRHAERLADGRCGPAQYLGIAADPRWAWHEFGHVLSFAASGELEFPFAHSAGDALAAIVHAPDSRFGPSSSQAGLTFPWVQIRRRHDRRASDGWCWCGRRNRLRLSKSARLPRPFSDYVEEQMLSSSLYTLYEVLGGHTRDPEDEAGSTAWRRRASDYAVYLIMRATACTGPSDVVPMSSADQFVSALADADVATDRWDAPTPWYDGGGMTRRRGGTAHKVVRWAFEKQGLFAEDRPDETCEGEGRPPNVDLFIPGIGDRACGGYAPVSLAWTTERPAEWHSGGITFQDGWFRVTIGNRGHLPSGPVRVRLWVGAAYPDRLAWVGPVFEGRAEELAGPESVKTVGFELPAAVARGTAVLCVLAEVSCVADRANSDPAASLACAIYDFPPTDTVELVDLVANDNNLGFALFSPM